MGGMIAIQFASLFPDFAKRLAVTACTAKTSPATVARRRVQRQAIVSDPNFAGGDYSDGNSKGIYTVQYSIRYIISLEQTWLVAQTPTAQAMTARPGPPRE